MHYAFCKAVRSHRRPLPFAVIYRSTACRFGCCVECVNCGTRWSWFISRVTSCQYLRDGYAASCSGKSMCLCSRPPSTILRLLTACSDQDSLWFSSEPSGEWRKNTLKYIMTASFQITHDSFPTSLCTFIN